MVDKKTIENVYAKLVAMIKKYAHTMSSVKVPNLYTKGSKDKIFTISGLSIVFFFINKGRIVTKTDLLVFLHSVLKKSASGYGPNTKKYSFISAHPRHFGMQRGFYFLIQDSFHPQARRTLLPGEYCLYSMTKPHPSAQNNHRSTNVSASSFKDLKATFENQCAVCGSKEGKANLKNKNILTRLEKGHMDPTLPLTLSNTIPMCTYCNQVYKNRFVFDKKGVIRKVL